MWVESGMLVKVPGILADSEVVNLLPMGKVVKCVGSIDSKNNRMILRPGRVN
jgi:hypothetical protein